MANKKAKKKTTKKIKESSASRFSRIQKSLPYSIKCAYTRLIEVHKLQPHPKNPNDHPDNQIALFAELMKFQGVRRPITVSSLSGFITKGHGQLAAMKLNGWDWAPVDIQEYDDEAQEFADIVADNALASQSRLDKAKINEYIVDLGPEFEVDTLAINNFTVEPLDNMQGVKDTKQGGGGGKPKDVKIIPEGEKKIIHVNQLAIKSNKKNKTESPVITVKYSGQNTYGHSAKISGESSVIYSPDKPQPCGAIVWIETTAEVRVYKIKA